MCIALCTIVAHNIAQNRPDSFPSYPLDNHHCSDDVYLREGVWKVTVRGKRQAVNRLTTTASAFVIIITDQQLHKICTLLSVMQYTTADTILTGCQIPRQRTKIRFSAHTLQTPPAPCQSTSNGSR